METLDTLTETLDTELKGWLILSEPREAALFAKACLALRNNNGGRLVLGIDDTTPKSIPPPRGFDPVQAYHVDKVNEVVGKYSLPKFEVRVRFKEYERRVHPEVIIAGGIQAPVITRSGFPPELRQNAVYVRTISNGRPSSCEPMTATDWDKLMRICFDNREADIGRFMRRHLPEILVEMGIDVQARSKQSGVHLEQAASDFLQQGWERLKSRWTEKFESPDA
jgi:hypothetical protein